MSKIRLPSPAMMVALLALFVALSGTAMAAGIVPLARRALVADNSKKLGGASLKAVVGGIAVAIPGLVEVKSQSFSLPASGGTDSTVACASGEKAVAGGFDTASGEVIALDTRPSSDGASWKIVLLNLSSTAAASGNAYAVCLG